ncbi:MAG: M3 family metallopeptidase [Xanthomonadales bacterium]|nr:M3 family metallopeptidase [Xanthomonadales bacterium]
MNTDNPLLHDTPLPAFAAIRPDHVVPAVRARIATARAAVERCAADAGAADFAAWLADIESAEDALQRSWSPVSHLHSVCDSPALREVYAEAEAMLTEYHSEVGQHRGLFEAYAGFQAEAERRQLGKVERSVLNHAVRDFELAGVALDEPARSRFRAIQQELSRLATEFEEAVLDASDQWHRDATAAEVDGLPETALSMLRREESSSHPFRIGLKQPHVQAVMTHARDRALREEVYRAWQTRASDQGPLAGRFDNSERIQRILALRHEAANLLGFANAAELSLAEKMATTPAQVLDFLRDLARRARPAAERELAELGEFARSELGLDSLQPWDIAFASERQREARFGFSEEDLRPYFALPRVLDGMLRIAERLFGVRFAERERIEAWHPDVRFVDVLDGEGRVIAGFYLDCYARQAKRGGAWMDVCRSRMSGSAAHLPIAYLTCNFPPPAGERPALVSHDDVVTLFHEFGHGLHHMLTEIGWPSVSGISGVEWDAVELPSQFMENFCWQRETLDLFAAHIDDGSTLPEDLLTRMNAARHFQSGLFLLRQIEFGLFDFRLHLEHDPAAPADPLTVLESVRDEVAVLRPPSWQRFPHAFTHIFSGGYAAGYYSYLWAEVLSADAFAAFEEKGLLDTHTGHRFRREILAVGGSRPAAESFVAFRGREPSPEPLLRSHGLAA